MATKVRRAIPALLVVVTGAICLLLLWSWRGELPDPVATHWGAGSVPDGFSSLTSVFLIVGLAGLVGVVFASVAAFAFRDATVARMMAGTAAGTAIFVMVLGTWVTGVQRGLDDAAAARLSGLVILGSVALGIAAGVFTGWVVPRSGRAVPLPAQVGKTPTAKSGSAADSWQGTATMPAPGLAGVLVFAAVIGGVMIPLTGEWWVAVLVVAVVAVPVLVFAGVRVSVDKRGVGIAGYLGVPRSFIPAAEIARAEVVPVRALRDFGGWGYRIAARGPLAGSKGFILRSGPALLVVRSDGRRDIVVIDGAEQAAALVNRGRRR